MMDMKAPPEPPIGAGEAVHYLEGLLAEVIAYLDGDEAAALVRRAQDVAGGDDEEALEALFHGLRIDQAVYLARAFTCASMLLNLGEDVAGRRRAAEAAVGDLPATLAQAAERVGAKVAGRILPRMTVAPVFTAHPTEVRRRAIVEREHEISQLMARRTEPDLTLVEQSRLKDDLFRAMCLLWKARMHRITPADEIRNTLAIVRESILPALSEIYDDWSERFETATPLTLGSWLGGDRDGHPGVTGETVKLALRSQARLILNHYSDEVRRLWFDMAISGELAAASPGVLALAAVTPNPSVHREDEPYRKALQEIWDRLAATADVIAGGAWGGTTPYAHASDFVTDLETIRASIRQHLGERVIGSRLRTLIAVAKACGFHLLALDLRQNADVHERMIHELYVRAGVNIDYLGSNEAERVRVLSKELSHDRPLRSPFLTYSEATERELGTLDAAAEVVRLYGETALSTYIISKTASLSDVLEPLVLLKGAGGRHGTQRAADHAAARDYRRPGARARVATPMAGVAAAAGAVRRGPVA